MATINWGQIKVQVAKDASGDLKAAAEQRAKEVFDDAAMGLMKDFEESRVTQEIDAGIGSANISDTLRGGEGPENLFSFIGFTEGDNPTEEVRKRLNPTDPDGPKLRYVGKDPSVARFTFEVNVLETKESIYRATPLPWAKGLSWVKKIETTIPGFGRFLARFSNTDSSRSGGGVQVKSTLRAANYVRPKDGYLTEMFNRFVERIRAYNKSGFKRRFTKTNS
jgi:hypothetical protein